MEFYIDGKRTPEKHFWNCLHRLASEEQVHRLLDGVPVTVGGVTYRIEILERIE